MKNTMESMIDYSRFDEDQMEEIRIGLEEGLDVSIYADPEFMPLKMEAIRIGLEKGLDVSKYARHEYDWFQMEEIRLGLEFGLPISRYANPDIPYKIMHEIRLGLAEGIDLGRQKNLDWKTLEQIRLAYSLGIDLNSYIEKGYDSYQLEEIRLAREVGIIMDPYLRPEFRAASIHEIRLGMEDFVDVTLYAKPEYNWQQMREIRLGLLEQLDVSKFSNHLYNWRQMREIRLGLADGLNVSAYNNLMYTEHDMHDMRVALLETMDIAGSNIQKSISSTNFKIEISEDGMQATFTLLGQLYGRTKTKIRNLLKENGIVAGISNAMLDTIVSEHKIGAPYIIANGRPAKTGRDGFYHFAFDPKSIGAKSGNDGALDLFHEKLFHIVKKGEKLAVYCPAEDGSSGYNIFGETLPAKRGKEMKKLHGKGVILLPDGKTYQSLMDGCVQYYEENSELNVIKMVVYPTVTLATGNVNFQGNVYVTGDVGDGVTINATEDIIVDGNVEAAVLNAGRNIYLKKGIHGKHRGELNARGNIASGYCEAVKIHSKGNFQTNYCMEVNAEIEGTTEIMGTKGSIIGGYLESQCGINCTTLGNAAGTLTRIRIGPTNKMNEKTRRLLMADDRVRKELLLLQRGMEKFHIRYSPEVYHNLELYQKLENAIYTKNLEMQKLNEAEMKLDQEMYAVRNAKVIIHGAIHEGVSIQIEDMLMNASYANDINICKINGRITVSRNES
ncbi:MAG: DUF342 domain-containing protein [Lachnospiraceae bacterium]|nr:DUF342 domain-containing protein [Lachnospiraceae bacterium]